MELESLIAALSALAAYKDPVASVEVRQTHISVVFLAGSHAYKIKKPLDLGFLDYSTLAKRRYCCEREVDLNRRLAPSVYLGVVPVTSDGTRITMDGTGETVEWAVKMTRLPDSATLKSRLHRDEVGADQVVDLANRIAAFHARADAGPTIAAAGRFETVARNARENFEQSEPLVGTTVSRSVFERLRRLTEEALARHRTLIEARAARGLPRDGHGDLRLGHVYLFPVREPPDDLVIVDCIEFADRFRHADPVADMAFLVMDFTRLGRKDLARAFADAYFQASGDAEGRTLLAFYSAYRAVVRGKVQGLQYRETEVPPADRARALSESRADWLLALGEIEEPGRRPGLVLIGGLPGSGKSTLAQQLLGAAGLTLIRSDLVRKTLADLAPGESARVDFEEGIYSPEWTARTYAECLRRAEELLFEGRRVLVDASFGRESARRSFLELASRWGVPAVFLLCLAEPTVIRARLAARRNDASDADWSIYQRAAERWEEPGPSTRSATRVIPTDGDPIESFSRALTELRKLGLQV